VCTCECDCVCMCVYVCVCACVCQYVYKTVLSITFAMLPIKTLELMKKALWLKRKATHGHLQLHPQGCIGNGAPLKKAYEQTTCRLVAK